MGIDRTQWHVDGSIRLGISLPTQYATLSEEVGWDLLTGVGDCRGEFSIHRDQPGTLHTEPSGHTQSEND